MSQILQNARAYESLHGSDIAPEQRPAFHLSPWIGWMNDPNGFSWYGGQYHMFFQYHPYDSHWGPMHWGHAVSRDLLHWEYLPCALAPDMPYDKDGCFSGSAIELPDGRQMLMYTGVRHETDANGQVREIQTQNLAFGDGVNYEKYAGNPVLTEADLPEGGSRYDFRDPKLLQAPDGSYLALIANDQQGEGGRILVFRSEDALHWSYVAPLASNRNRLGLMWECPDFFRLDGYDVLLASAQDMLPKDFEYHNGNGSFYLLGHCSDTDGAYTVESDHAADYGIDFYAPQTVLTPDGRRVMIGWMQNWDTCNLHTRWVPWFGQMSLPRELSVRDGVLCQQPLRELELMRTDEVRHEDVLIRDEEIRLPGVSGRTVDLELEIEPVGPVYSRFAIRFAKNGLYQTTVSFRPHESVLKIDRKFSGSRRAIIHQRRAKVRHEGGRLKLRLILDRYSAEVFVNDGEQVLSATVSTDLSAKDISFYADGEVRLKAVKYTLQA
ncbi:MAG: glycoside hydrolase family 32 protein [Oscillospiraceae bacterium]|nr:glycoside hydrolase family 32 protein [Oscillospiraceae bacterium]